jgi:hypothetical protein
MGYISAQHCGLETSNGLPAPSRLIIFALVCCLGCCCCCCSARRLSNEHAPQVHPPTHALQQQQQQQQQQQHQSQDTAPYNPYPHPANTTHHVLTNDSMPAILAAVASPQQRAVIFTTLRFGDEKETEDVLPMISTFCYWLAHAGLLKHTMIITTDERWVGFGVGGGGAARCAGNASPCANSRRECQKDSQSTMAACPGGMFRVRAMDTLATCLVARAACCLLQYNTHTTVVQGETWGGGPPYAVP